MRPNGDMRSELIDNFGRRINYVRLSVTDRCNLRCSYCMPEVMRFLPRNEILTYEEMERLLGILAQMGIDKVRITGGEPFVRKSLIDFLERVRAIPGISRIHITTNGVLTTEYVPRLKALGIAGINLSLDTLDRNRFHQMTRRDEFDRVMACFHAVLAHEIPLKVNAVIMDGINTADILPLIRLTGDHPVSVRFIEEMPFNGSDKGKSRLVWNHRRILEEIRKAYPQLSPIDAEPAATATTFAIPGHAGTVGIIAGFTRTFCGTCNRIRINARGRLQTCLYGKNVLDIKALLRGGADDAQIAAAVQARIGQRFRDGWEAQTHREAEQPRSDSMSLIGG